jgi:hypothetical protein
MLLKHAPILLYRWPRLHNEKSPFDIGFAFAFDDERALLHAIRPLLARPNTAIAAFGL